MIKGFYEEPEDSLDAVYIGSSNCFRFWNPLLAWQEFGITVYNYASDDFPFEATPYVIEEARKTQPNALFLVNLNTLHDSTINENLLHYLSDNMPMSRNRIAMINHLAEAGNWDWATRMDFYFPFIRFHAQWPEVQMSDFSSSSDRLKGANISFRYVGRYQNISDQYRISEECTAPSDWMMQSVDTLLAYCDEEEVNILFVVVPRAEEEAGVVSQLNYLESYITAQGYPVLNMMNDPDAVGLDLAVDFYNIGHTNIHGSAKFTRFLSRYLIDTYGFADKREEDAYAPWNKAWRKYLPQIQPYMLDFEFTGGNRDLTLSAPETTDAVLSGDSVLLSWTAVDGAEGYRVYRKLEHVRWEPLADTNEPHYIDTYPGEEKSPRYLVVPFRLDSGGIPLFGRFIPKGISAE